MKASKAIYSSNGWPFPQAEDQSWAGRSGAAVREKHSQGAKDTSREGRGREGKGE